MKLDNTAGGRSKFDALIAEISKFGNAVVSAAEADTKADTKNIERLAAEIKAINDKANWQFWLNVALTVVLTSALTYFLGVGQISVQDETAAAQVGMQLTDSWRETLTAENRKRLQALMDLIEFLGKKKQFSEREAALRILANGKKAKDEAEIEKNDILKLLLAEDVRRIKSADPEITDGKALADAATEFRASIVSILNTVESVRTVRVKSESEKIRDTVDLQFRQITATWTKGLWPFIYYYREEQGQTGDLPAWNVLVSADGHLLPEKPFNIPSPYPKLPPMAIPPTK